MNKKQLAERLARESHRSRGEAADTVDKLVYGIIKDLKTSQSAPQKKIATHPAKATPRQKDSLATPAPKTEKDRS